MGWSPPTLAVRPEVPGQTQLARRPVEAGVAEALTVQREHLQAGAPVVAGGVGSSGTGCKTRAGVIPGDPGSPQACTVGSWGQRGSGRGVAEGPGGSVCAAPGRPCVPAAPPGGKAWPGAGLTLAVRLEVALAALGQGERHDALIPAALQRPRVVYPPVGAGLRHALEAEWTGCVRARACELARPLQENLGTVWVENRISKQ